jgi:hypothetical protein
LGLVDRDPTDEHMANAEAELLHCPHVADELAAEAPLVFPSKANGACGLLIHDYGEPLRPIVPEEIETTYEDERLPVRMARVVRPVERDAEGELNGGRPISLDVRLDEVTERVVVLKVIIQSTEGIHEGLGVSGGGLVVSPFS